MQSDRRAMIAKIHIAKKRLGLDDDAYRAVLARVTGHDSAGALDEKALRAVLAEFRRLGFADAPRRMSEKPWVRKVFAIWGDLKPLLDDATDATLNSFVQRQTRTAANPQGIARAEWLTAEASTAVIQGLEGWLARARRKGAV